jgi:gluconokinase
LTVLALDIGSSSTRAAMFDARGRRVGPVFAQSYAMRYGVDGAAELNPRMARMAANRALSSFKTKSFDALGSCAFWHGLLGLDARLRPLTPIYCWADSRSERDAAQLRAQFSENEILQRTGCMLRFPFWPAKLRWLRRTNRALFRRVRFWVSPSDWILHDLFGDLATSESMASATGLFDLTSRRWDREVCDAAGIRESHLPPIREALADPSEGRASARPRILTPIGDGAAGNIGSGAISEDMAAINLGTSAAVRVMTRRALRIPHGLFRFVVSGRASVLGGATSNSGNLRVWCQRQLHLPRSTRIERRPADLLTALPFVVKERSPDWPEFSGAISGYNLTTTPLEIFRALMTSALYRIADIFDKLEPAVGRIRRIIVSGGLTRSEDIVAILADALGRDLELAINTEASLRGAALHALAHGADFLPPQNQGRIIRCNKTFAELHHGRRAKQRRFAHEWSSRSRNRWQF